MLDRIPPYLKNKFVITILIFFVWMLIFDRNNIINQIKLVSLKHSMIGQKQFLHNEIVKDSTSLHLLSTDTSDIEKYAREKFYMKKDNEDIFIVLDKK